MNRKLRNVLILSVIALILSGGLVYQSVQAEQLQQQGDGAARTISVTGIGQASAEPDVVVTTLGVRTDADTAQEALSENNDKMEQLLAALGDAGIDEADIQTISIQLMPRFEETQGQQETTPGIAGYTAANIVEVRIRDIDQLGELIDSAVSAGGNTVEGIRFEVESNRADLYNQALEAAMEDARAKAEQLASLAGAELGEVVQIVEGSAFPIPLGGGAVREAAVPIEPGTQSITANLQVTWSLVESGTIPGTGQTATTAATRTATRSPTRQATAAATRTATSGATTTAEVTETGGATTTAGATSTTGATTTVDVTLTPGETTTAGTTTTPDGTTTTGTVTTTP
jgi:uncharacterized protein YggE